MLKCYVIGETTLALNCCEVLREHSWEILGIITPNESLNFWAQDNNIVCYASLKDFRAQLPSLQRCDFLFSIVNLQILPDDILNIAQQFPINFHDSYLPAYAGLNSTSWAIINDEKTHGITWHKMTKGIDAGDILIQSKIAIASNETAFSLNMKCYESAIADFQLLENSLRNQTFSAKPQDISLRSVCPASHELPSLGVIQWGNSAEAIDRLSRALFLGSYSNNLLGLPKILIDNQFFILKRYKIDENTSRGRAGEIMAISDSAIILSTTSFDVILYEVSDLIGRVYPAVSLIDKFNYKIGDLFPTVDSEYLAEIVEISKHAKKHEKKWNAQLSNIINISRSTTFIHDSNQVLQKQDYKVESENALLILPGVLLALYILNDFSPLVVWLNNDVLQKQSAESFGLFPEYVPFEINFPSQYNISELIKLINEKLKFVLESPYCNDIFLRYPFLADFNHNKDIIINLDKKAELHTHFFHNNTKLVINAVQDKFSIWQSNNPHNIPSQDLFDYIQNTIKFIEENEHKNIADFIFLPDNSLQILSALNQTYRDYSKEKTLLVLFEEQAKRTPNKTAILFENRILTYYELNAKANKIAHYLQTQTINHPDRLVGLGTERSFEMIIGVFAILKAGCAYVPMDPTLPDERLRHMLNDTKMEILLTRNKQSERWMHLLADKQQCALLSLDQTDIYADSSEANLVVAIPQQLAYVLYTSGTTGKPKGVMIEHRSLTNLLIAMNETLEVNENFTFLASTNMSFDIAGLEWYSPLISGGSIILATQAETKDTRELVNLIKRTSPSIIQATPSRWEILLDLGWKAESASVKLLVGGEALNSALAAKLLAQSDKVWNVYGPTETTIWSSCVRVLKDQSIHIGKPLANTQFYVLNQHLRQVPVGVVGELYIGGEGLARGYLNELALTQQRFREVPFLEDEKLYKTGDLVRWTANENLDYLGRNDFQAKIRGYRIECEEIESIIRKELELMVKNIAVMVRDDTGKKCLVAYIVLKTAGHEELIKKRLTDSLISKVPDYMIPSAILFLKHFPLNVNGKLDQKKLPAPNFQSKDDYIEPDTELGQQLAKIWVEILKINRVGLLDNFHHLAGNSLGATRIMSQISQLWKIELPLTALFDTPRFDDFLKIVEIALKNQAVKTTSTLVAKTRPEHLSLSFAQYRLSIFDQYSPNNAVYNIPLALKLVGKININAMEKSINTLMERHEILRTALQSTKEENQAEQIVYPLGSCNISLRPIQLVLSDSLEEIMKSEAMKPFDLSKAPLLRANLIIQSDGTHVLLLTLHHTITDGWSQKILSHELSVYYNYFAYKVPPKLSALMLQYADFTLWQHESLQGEVLERQLAYWAERLSNIPVSLELPFDYTRPKELTYQGRSLTRKLSAELSLKVNALAQKNGATLFMVLLSNFYVLLHRYTAQTKIVVGSVFANRHYPEIEGLVGFFANTLALSAEIKNDESFLNLLTQVKRSTLSAHAYQDTPFEKLVQHLKIERISNQNPLFQVMFVMQDNEQRQWDFNGLMVEELDIIHPIAKFDLNIQATELSTGEISLSFEYSTELFKSETIQRMINHFEQLLCGVVETPEKKLSELPLLTHAEQQALLLDWNKTQRDYPQGKTLLSLFEEQVQRTLNDSALIFEGQLLSYNELNQRANQLARYIRNNYKESTGGEFVSDTLIALCLDRSIEMLVAVLGVIKAGGAYVPMDPNVPEDRLNFMLKETSSPFILTNSYLMTRLSAITSKKLIDLDEHPYQMEITSNLGIQVKPSDLAYVIYTSGTTGEPKGVMITHEGIVNRLQWMNEQYPLGKNDRILQKTPYVFDVSVWELFWAHQQGATVVIAKPEGHTDPSYLMQLIEEMKITVIHFVPSMLKVFLTQMQQDEKKLPSLSHIFASGEALDVRESNECLALFPTACLHNLYGPTEASVDVLYYDCLKDASRMLIGQPIANMQVYVLDPQSKLLPVGVSGELYIGGIGLARGYLNQTGLTAERFVDIPSISENKLYKTGDLVRWTLEGKLEYLGRNDFQVKIHGYRIECGEIERAIYSELESIIQKVVVIARKDATEKYLVAYIELKAQENNEVIQQALEEALKKKLPDYMIPKVMVFVENWPLSNNGKLEREKLPTPNFQGKEEDYVEPDTALSRQLAEIWTNNLKKEIRIGLHNNFFTVGGDSISAIPVLSLSKKLGVNLTLQQFLRSPTISGMLEQAAINKKSNQLTETLPSTAPWDLVSNNIKENYEEQFEDIYPVSQMQQALVLFSERKKEEKKDIYEIYLTYYTFSGVLDSDKLSQALALTIEKHPILRSSLNRKDFDEIMLCVHRNANMSIQYNDLSELDETTSQEQFRQFLKTEIIKPFDWTKAPLLRVIVHKMHDNHYHVTLSEPWLDGWSVSIVGSDFLRFYSQLLSNQPIVNSPTVSSYRDFVAMERKVVDSEEQKQFWHKELSKRPIFSGVFKHLQQNPQSFRRNFLVEDQEKLKRIAAQLGVSLKHVLLAAHMRVVSLLNANSPKTISGLLANGRPEEMGSEQTVGLFLNVMPFQINLKGMNWLGSIKAIYDKEMQLLPYRRYPYSKIIKEQGNVELFETMFNFIDFHHYKKMPATPDFNLLEEVGSDQTYFPLTTICSIEKGGELVVNLLANLDICSVSFVERIGQYYLNALSAIANQPLKNCITTSLLSTDEEYYLRNTLNNTHTELNSKRCLHHFFEEQVTKTPDNEALIFEGQSLTYRQLNHKANQLARYLRKEYEVIKGKTFTSDTLIVLCLERSFEMLIGILGILKAGGAYVPIDPSCPHDRLNFMLKDTDTPFVLTQSHLLSVLPKNLSCSLICLDEGTYHQENSDTHNLNILVNPTDLAYVIYTSGTTGQPKGVMTPHEGIVNRLKWMTLRYPLKENDRVMQKTPYVFDVSLWELFWANQQGATLVIAKPEGHKDPEYLAQLIHETNITMIHFVPSMFKAFLAYVEHKSCQLTTLSRIFASGEALDAKESNLAHELFPTISIHNLYGPTEASVEVLYYDCPKRTAVMYIGKPISNMQAYVLDEKLQLLPMGVVGELHISGIGLARGYLNRPKLTAERFINNPFIPGKKLYKTGDLVRWSLDGQLEYLGRNDFQVKINGYRIECGEIENVIKNAFKKAINDVVVIARENKGEKRLVVYVILKEPEYEHSLRKEFKTALLTKLPDYMIPSHIMVIDKMPLNISGKVDRNALPELTQSVQLNNEYKEPETLTEERLAALWLSLLPQDLPPTFRIGLQDSFLNIGGDSLSLMRLQLKIQKEWKVDVNLESIFKALSLRAMAQVIDNALKCTLSILNQQLRPEHIPLSCSQHRLWILDKFTQGKALYQIPLVLKLKGKCNINALAQAYSFMIERHESLRTRFEWIENESFQVIDSPQKIPGLMIHDIAHLSKDLKSYLEEAILVPFNLTTGPLIWGKLITLKEDEYILCINMHHIITDGVSIQIYWKELFEFYRHYSEGTLLALPKLNIQYADYTLWQKASLKTDILQEHLAYWKEQLADIPTVISLPTDYIRPQKMTYAGGRIYFSLPETSILDLKSLADENQATVFMVLLSALQIILHRYSGQKTIVVGSPIANRRAEEIQSLIGFFVNTLALKADFNQRLTVTELIKQIKKTALSAYAHQDLPFEQLVEHLDVPRQLNVNPVFQVMLAYRNVEEILGLDDLHVSVEQVEYPVAKFDLTLSVQSKGKQLNCSVEYAKDLFEESTIQRFIQHFQTIISVLAKHKNITIDALPMLSETEIHQQLVTWNQTECEYPKTTIHGLFEAQVKKTPENIALICDDQKMTYHELNGKANRVAHYLRTQGIGSKPDMLVGLGVERSCEMIIGMIAILKAGAAYVPMDPKLPDERLSYMQGDTQITLLLAQKSNRTRWISLLGGNSACTVVSLDDTEVYAELSSENLIPVAYFNHLAYVIYTSGSTGQPKGVMIEHHSVCNYSQHIAHTLQPAANISPRRVDCSSSLSFDLTVTTTITPLLQGDTICIYSGNFNEIDRYIKHLNDNQVSLIKTVPSVAKLIFGYSSFPYLNEIILGGEKIDDFLLQKLSVLHRSGKTIYDEYGPTESTVGCMVSPLFDSSYQGIGKPIQNAQLYVLDEHRQLLPKGSMGELYIGGVGLARGYLNRADITQERFIWQQWHDTSEPTRLYRTGDLVRYLSEGNIEYIGRVDNQIKIRGFRIELEEIETQLLKLSHVMSAAVVVNGQADNKQLVAYFLSNRVFDDIEYTQAHEINALKGQLATFLPEYMIPTHMIFLDEMPLNANGKIDRKKLPKFELNLLESYIAPQDTLEIMVCNIWKEILGLKRISTEEDFFRIGGNSIKSIELLWRLRNANYPCSIEQIFKGRTISQLADILRDNLEQVIIDAEQGILEGPLALLPIQHYFFESNFNNKNHWNQSFLIKVPCLDPSRLNNILAELANQHDALRLRYQGKKQFYLDKLVIPALKELNCTGLTVEEMQTQLTDWQSHFDIENGPLWQVCYIDGYADGSARIYFALHHLIVDAVSWRILAEDLKKLYEGKPLEKKTSSYRQWINAVNKYAENNILELDYWKEIVSHQNEQTIYKNATNKPIQYSLTFEENLTKNLLRDSHGAYHTEINDLLLTALGLSLKQLTNMSINYISLEGHGRENIDDSIDVTRTVGWFTTLYPVKLEVDDDIVISIQRIKEILRKIPSKGLGYGALKYGLKESVLRDYPLPPICFNYLGQFDANSDSLWQVKRELSGLRSSIENKEGNILNINGWIADGRLQFTVLSELSDTTSRLFIDAFKSNLEKIVHHCVIQVNSKIAIYTPSDFHYVNLNKRLLDKLQSRYDIEAVYSANSLQQGFIYYAATQPHDDAYRVQSLMDYNTPLNSLNYKKAWGLVIQTYPILRTCFNWDKDFIQIINKKGNLWWKEHDITQESDKEGAIKRIQEFDRKQAFDLSQPNLLRIHLIKHSTEHYTMMMSSHHVISDGWSNAILLKKVHDYYALLMHEKPIVIQKDKSYTNAQEYYIKHRSKVDTYWKKQLATLKEVNDLNVFFQKNIHLDDIKVIADSQETVLMIQGEDYKALESLVRAEGLTLNVLLQYAWHKLIQVYTRDTQTIVGTTVSGRDLPIAGIEKSVGLYINTLPLVINWDEDDNILMQLKNLHQNIMMLNAHNYAHLAPLQSSGKRLFHSLFIFENYPRVVSSIGTLEAKHRSSYEKLDYPLGIIAYEINHELCVKLKYAGEYLDQKMACQLLNQISLILKDIPGKLHEKNNVLNLLSHEEYHQLQKLHGSSIHEYYPKEKNLVTLFEEQVEKYPHNIAVFFENKSVTYQALNEKANQLTHYLRAKGIGNTPDNLVGLGTERSVEMLIGVLAILKAGGAYVPMDPTLPEERLRYMINNTKIRIILTQDHLAERWSRLLNNQCQGIIVPINQREIFAEFSLHNLNSTIAPHHLAYVIYTSGTTGQPKGVMISHQNIVNLLFSMNKTLNIQENSRFLALTNMSFDIAGLEWYSPLISGGSIALANQDQAMDCSVLIDFIKIMRPSVIQATPSRWKMLLDLDWKAENDMTLLVGGEALNQALAERLLPQSDKVWNVYGPTETTIWSSCVRIQKNEMIHIGRPLANTKMYVLNEHLRLLPLGVAGELYLGGDGLARGYLNLPELTHERFVDSPFELGKKLYRTGDLARWTSEGKLEYLGRNDFQVKIRGHRIECEEIEQRLRLASFVKDVAIMGHERNDEKFLVAYIVPKELMSEEMIQERVKTSLANQLPEYMIPSHVLLLDKLPLNSNGKMDKKALLKYELRNNRRKIVAPANPIEAIIFEIWKKVLNHANISVHDEFTVVGGSSLLWAKVLYEVNQTFEVPVTLGNIIQYRTISDFAQFLESMDSVVKPVTIIRTIKSEGHLKPLFLVHPVNGLSYMYDALSLHIQDRPLYGIDNPHFGTDKVTFDSIEEMAHVYANEIRKIQKTGPYFIVGHSFGGMVAYEMARELHALGEEIGAVIIIDSHMKRTPSNLDEIFKNKMIEARVDLSSQLAKYIWVQYQRHFELAQHYTPKPYDGSRVAYIWCRSPLIHDLKKKMEYWSACESVLEIHSIPGGHDEIFDIEFIESTAEKMLLALDDNIDREMLSSKTHHFLTRQLNFSKQQNAPLLMKHLNELYVIYNAAKSIQRFFRNSVKKEIMKNSIVSDNAVNSP